MSPKRTWVAVLQVTEYARPALDELSTTRQMRREIKAKFFGDFIKAKVIGLKKIKP